MEDRPKHGVFRPMSHLGLISTGENRRGWTNTDHSHADWTVALTEMKATQITDWLDDTFHPGIIAPGG